MSAVSDDVVFAAIFDRTMTRSVDAGATSTMFLHTNAVIHHAVGAVDASTAWSVGEDGAIAKTQQAVTINDYGGVNTWSNLAEPSLFGVYQATATVEALAPDV